MKLDEFKTMLTKLKAGKVVVLNYEMFEILFPPGVEHDRAKDAAFNVAQASGWYRQPCGQKEHIFRKVITKKTAPRLRSAA